MLIPRIFSTGLSRCLRTQVKAKAVEIEEAVYGPSPPADLIEKQAKAKVRCNPCGQDD